MTGMLDGAIKWDGGETLQECKIPARGRTARTYHRGGCHLPVNVGLQGRMIYNHCDQDLLRLRPQPQSHLQIA
jgi:hypothetical protein